MNGYSTSWVVRGGRLLAPRAFGIMGIVNLTPDSFLPSSRSAGPDDSRTKALALQRAGADVLDLGGLSTRPGSEAVGEEEEVRRLLPVFLGLREKPVIISIDTYRASVAETFLRLGASIINDVSGALWDPALAEVLFTWKPGYVLTHSNGMPKTMQRAPHYEHVVDEVASFFDERLSFLTKNGLPEDRIVLDVGIGFGKSLAHNLELLSGIATFHSFGRPLLMGLSMKSLFLDLLGLEKEERGEATDIASAILYTRGVTWHRVHDAGAVRRSLLLADSLC
ncbi:MAG: dihydropteroate synthase [Desulfovibrio sp.]|nr:dihydropteroate synthase [Desulfovibrio sp.]